MKIKESISTILFAVIVIGCLLSLRIFVFTPVVVKGHSMDPTLADGERVIALKHSKVKRYDIVTFPAPDENEKNYIKRVIGLPGETVEMKNDVLYIDGKAIDEPYLDEFKEALKDNKPLTSDFTLEQVTNYKTVPEGKYFVMGDNRRNSKDSRIIGFIDAKDISGDVKFVIWPFKRFGLLPTN